MRVSLLDVLVGQQVRLIVTTRDGDPAKGEELSQQDVEIVGQLLYLPDLPDSAMPDGFQHHGVHAADGKRHAIYDDDVRRVEVLDPATGEVILFARCTAEFNDSSAFGRPRHSHQGAQCCVHEVHASGHHGRRSPGS